MSAYRVERREHGVVVVGPVPCSELVVLLRAWDEQGLDLLDGLIAGHLKATMVVCSRAASETWRRELGEVARLRARVAELEAYQSDRAAELDRLHEQLRQVCAGQVAASKRVVELEEEVGAWRDDAIERGERQ